MTRIQRTAAWLVLGAILGGVSATTAIAQDDLAESEALLREVLELRRSSLGEDHPQTLQTQRRLSRVLLAAGKREEATALLRGVVKTSTQIFGPSHPETLAAKETLAMALLGTRAPASAAAESTLNVKPKIVKVYSQREIQRSIDRGLKWLADHQADDGRWDADGKGEGAAAYPDAGSALNDIGVTGLSLLAFLGSGETTEIGPHRGSVKKAVKFLLESQDADTGLLGRRVSQQFMYNHGIAALALSETYLLTRNPIFKAPAQNAINFILRARNPYKAWRYDSPPIGDNDTSVTGWMLMALASARDAGLRVDPAAFEGGMTWIDEVTDPETGRTGYNSRGTVSAREVSTLSDFPPDLSEAMTSVALVCRFLHGQGPDDAIVQKSASRLFERPPTWDEEAKSCDMTYWMFGSMASYQLGGNHWDRWQSHLLAAVLPNQNDENERVAGSWDPVGPWGKTGGRVYSTAAVVISLQTAHRWAKIR